MGSKCDNLESQIRFRTFIINFRDFQPLIYYNSSYMQDVMFSIFFFTHYTHTNNTDIESIILISRCYSKILSTYNEPTLLTNDFFLICHSHLINVTKFGLFVHQLLVSSIACDCDI